MEQKIISEEKFELLTASEVASMLKVVPSTVYRLMRRGEITVVRFGRSVRIRPEDLQKFINTHTAGEY